MCEKLYKVELQDYKFGIFYVVAGDPTTAYEQVRKPLDEKDLGFKKDRELKTITLIADAREYAEIDRLIL